MTLSRFLLKLVLGLAALHCTVASARPLLDLRGYSDANGAITILNGGDTTDPYFALQALLLAHDNGLDTSAPAAKFANWLVGRQKPDGTFDRFCKGENNPWASCKTADADDSLLALWMRLLQTMPDQLSQNAVWTKSHAASKKALENLYQPSRGVYMVSPVVLHGLFMDNLEVWSLLSPLQKANTKVPDKLAQDIYSTFWQPVDKHFLVSTQLEQRGQKAQFYPDHVAQIFPMLVNFPLLPTAPKVYYQHWMAMHRAEWLKQGEKDYPWGLLAVLALRQGDTQSAGCWLRETSHLRHSQRWAVTDEVARQILDSRQTRVAGKVERCS